MAKKVYIGVNNVARQVKKIYIGVSDKARKVKKGYIGIGGVARPFWTSGELAYYGTITPLSVERYDLASTPVGNYALFGGGFNVNNDYPQDTVDAYNKSLTRSTPTKLSAARGSISATSVGDYAIFAGGYTTTAFDSVEAYNTVLTRSTPTKLSFSTYKMAATTIGNYALFAGGDTDEHGGYTKVYAYNKSLTQSFPTALNSNCAGASYGVTVGDYGVIAKVNSKYISAYNKSLTQSNVTWATALYTGFATAVINNRALFAGGTNVSGNTFYTTVRWCNTSLTQGTLSTGLSKGRSLFAGATVSNGDVSYAVFGGGNTSNTHAYVATVDSYDESLTRTVQPSLNTARAALSATTVGNYALFAGGRGGSYGSTSYSTVDAFIVD